MLSKDSRESWLVLVSCGRYKPKSLYPLQTKNGSSGANATQKKFLTSSTGLADSNPTSTISSKTGYDSSIDDCSKKERYTNMPLKAVAEQKKEKPSVMAFNNPTVMASNNQVESAGVNSDSNGRNDTNA